jgi:hypothetical protein
MKLKKFKKPFIFWLPIGTNCRNVASFLFLKFQKIGPFFSQKSTYFSAFSALKNEKKIKNHPPTKEFDCASAVIITSN